MKVRNIVWISEPCTRMSKDLIPYFSGRVNSKILGSRQLFHSCKNESLLIGVGLTLKTRLENCRLIKAHWLEHLNRREEGRERSKHQGRLLSIRPPYNSSQKMSTGRNDPHSSVLVMDSATLRAFCELDTSALSALMDRFCCTPCFSKQQYTSFVLCEIPGRMYNTCCFIVVIVSVLQRICLGKKWLGIRKMKFWCRKFAFF